MHNVVCPECDATCQQALAAASERLRLQLESTLSSASAGPNSAKAAYPGPEWLHVAQDIHQ